MSTNPSRRESYDSEAGLVPIEVCFIQMALATAVSFISSVQEARAFEVSKTSRRCADENEQNLDDSLLANLPIEEAAYSALTNKLCYTNHHFDREDKQIVSEAARLLSIVRAEAVRRYRSGEFTTFGGEAMEEMLEIFDTAISHCQANSLKECEHAVDSNAELFYARAKVILVVILGIIITLILINRSST